MSPSEHEPLLCGNENGESPHTVPPLRSPAAINTQGYGSVVPCRSGSSNVMYKTSPAVAQCEFHDSDEPTCFPCDIMEKVKRSKVAHWANKLAVENDQNLTTAQLML